MNILETIRQANGGKLIAGFAETVGLTAKDVEHAMAVLVPNIAQQIQVKAETDPQDYEHLMDVVDDEEQLNFLEKPQWAFSDEAFEDGQDILNHLYSSDDNVSEIFNDIEELNSLSNEQKIRIATFAATSTVAAMANRNQALFLSNDPQDDQPGIISMIITALIKGVIQSLTRRRARPRRRSRRRSYGRRRSTRRRKSRRRKTRRRRTKTKIIDLIGDLFRG